MGPPDIVTWETWSGKPPVQGITRKLTLPVRRVYFTITLTDMCFTLSSCAQQIMYIKEAELRRNFSSYQRNGPKLDVPFNFMIGGDGCVYEGRGWNKSPDLPSDYRKYSQKSILVAFIGNFRRYPPSWKMFQARDDLIDFGIENEYIFKQYLPSNINNF